MKKQKLTITLKALNKVEDQFPQTKELIEERLEQKYLKENTSVEEVIFLFFFTSLEAELGQNLFCSVRF